jgi:hypothetical protein
MAQGLDWEALDLNTLLVDTPDAIFAPTTYVFVFVAPDAFGVID